MSNTFFTDSFKKDLFRSFERNEEKIQQIRESMNVKGAQKSGKLKRLKKFRPLNLKLPIKKVEENEPMMECYDNRDNILSMQTGEYQISSSGKFCVHELKIGSQGISDMPASFTTQLASDPYFPPKPDSHDHFLHINYSEKSKNSSITDEKFNSPETGSKIQLKDLTQLRKLGSGASSNVFLVQHSKYLAKYAMKILDLGQDFQSSIIHQEIRSLYKCKKCPYIVSFHEAYFKNYQIHMLLEFMSGGTLENFLKKDFIPENILSFIAYFVLKGLQYLHSKKIVHRDIKPANVLLSLNGDVKLGDFGLTGSYKPNHLDDARKKKLMFQSVKGTLIYMSPERILEKEHTFNSDIWSLGITLIELCNGQLPFKKSSSYFDILENIKECSQNPPIGKNVDQYSKSFKHFLTQCFIENPQERPTSSDMLNHEWIINNILDEDQMRKRIKKWAF